MKLTFLPKLFVLSVAALISFCSLKDPDQKLPDPTTQVKFEVVDSLIVNVLEDLTILDYQESTDRYLMKQLRGGKVVVTDGKGNVISSHEIAGEGPNQVPNVWEGRFFEPDGYIFKEMSATMDFHVYNADFQKTEKIKGPAVGLNAIFISFYRQSFNVFEKSGKKYILGEEVNSYDGGLINHEKLGGEFYNQAKTGYFYDLSQDSITYLNLFPENWEPRRSRKWIGQSFPFMAFDAENSKVAVLPPMGDALFLYDLKGTSLQNETTVRLSHPERNQPIPDPSRENFLYPSFSDVKMFGGYQLVIFYSAVPEEVYQEVRSKGENYHQDPAWRAAVVKYQTPRYLIVKDGTQLGITNDLPVVGHVNLGLADGSLLVKAADGEIERDYNLFYKIRLLDK